MVPECEDCARRSAADDHPPIASSSAADESTEIRAAFKTTELIVYVLAVAGVLIASAIVDNNFGADPAWRYVTYLTVGYMISSGLAKAGSRNPKPEGE